MGVNGNGTANATSILQFTCALTELGETWQFVSVSSGTYELSNPNSGKCATATGTANVSLFELQACTGSSRQTFTLKLFSGAYYQLINTGSSRCLDVRGQSTSDSAQFELYDCDAFAPADNQAFRFDAP